MKPYFAVVVLLTLISISVFGFVGLAEMHSAMGSGCGGNFAGSTPCPVKDGIFALAFPHAGASQNLSQSGFMNVSPIFILALVLLAFAFVSANSSRPDSYLSSRSYFKNNFEDKVRDPGFKKVFWLARLENSPSFIKGA